MRPSSIIWFERLFLAALAIGLVNSLMILNAINADQAGQPLSPSVLIGSIVVGNIINVVLWYFVARRASNIARWILVALFVLGALSLGFSVMTDSYPGGIEGLLGAIGWALQAASILCLFRRDAATWFESEPGDDLGEPAQ
ncbi:hypothetical protein [Sphingomonas sp.]|uniref:hypothetical protein n=1 Tax=Sphingomonas sp. TaxID=28214 RepID=UPI002CB9803E|nr:hypothetical protein [Sphingomonas sp.]HTG37838.1 hypothetical protein [Sphingomonas sp.]